MDRNTLSHRRADARLRILNPDGTPAANREVRADQVSHKFLFGCGAFDTVEIQKTQDAGVQELLRERMEKWLGLFNYATLPFYWGSYEPEEGKRFEKETIAAAEWLKERGVTSLHTDENGVLVFNGFKGGYRLQTEDGNASFRLDGDTGAQVQLTDA